MIYLSELKGKEVIDKVASIVGVVEDVAIDEGQMQVKHLVVLIDKGKRDTFHLGKGLFGGSKKIDILAEEVGAIADKVLLNRTLAEILDVSDDEGDPNG